MPRPAAGGRGFDPPVSGKTRHRQAGTAPPMNGVDVYIGIGTLILIILLVLLLT
jgi:hypothetical protein